MEGEWSAASGKAEAIDGDSVRGKWIKSYDVHMLLKKRSGCIKNYTGVYVIRHLIQYNAYYYNLPLDYLQDVNMS